MSTVYERRMLIPFENRTLIVPQDDDARTIYISAENRTVIVEASTTSAERTVYATED